MSQIKLPWLASIAAPLIVATMIAAPLKVAAQPDTYPNKPVRMVVGYSPGGGTDIIARIIAPALSEELGQTVFVDNRPGASGTIGAGAVAKSPGDGYTLMMGVVSLNAVLPSLFANLPYDTANDFVPVTLTASVPHFVAVHPSLPVHTLKELVDYAKAHPGELSFPSAGNGTTPHLAGEMFKSMTGTDMLHVPYKSTGQGMPDLLSGKHLVSFDTYPTMATFVRSGKLRALAVTGEARLSDFPEVPTAQEAGLAGYRISTWYGLFAPKGTPASIVALLHAKTAKAMSKPNTVARLREAGTDSTVTHTPQEFTTLVKSDTERYAKVVREARIKLE